MTECNGCGACCHPFQMPYSPADVQRLTATGRLDPGEAAFYRDHLTPMRRGEARRLIGHWAGPFSAVMDPLTGELDFVWQHYYRCDLYDETERRCTDYEHRPDVCRRYPWYESPPDGNKVLPPTCSYRADVGLPVEPVAVADPVRRRR